MGPVGEKTPSRLGRPSRATTQWLFRPYWKRVRFELGDRVYVSSSAWALPGEKANSGRLRFWGKIHCAAGYWAGVELDLPNGQNDGSLDGHRYFLCHPNRGLFVRITRCRTCAGHGVSDARYVSFPTRTPGRKADDDGWYANPSLVNTPNTADALNGKFGPSKLCRSEILRRTCKGVTSRRTCKGVISSGVLQSSYERSRVDSRLNAVRWVPDDVSIAGPGESCRRRAGIHSEENPSEGVSPEMSAGSSRSSSPESSTSGSDSPEIDLDQVLHEVLTPPAKMAEIVAVPAADRHSESDSSTTTVEAAKAERRRQLLIKSYSHWARNREKHRRRDQGRTSGGTYCRATTENEAASSTRTLVVSSNSEARAVCRNLSTKPECWKRSGSSSIDCVREFWSPGAASRQLLLSRSLSRARIFVTGSRLYDIPRGPSLIRTPLPLRQSRLCHGNMSTPHEPGMPLAPSADTRPPADNTEATEGALALNAEVTGRTRARVEGPYSFRGGVQVGCPAEARDAFWQIAHRPILHAQRTETSKEPWRCLPAATAPEWRETSDKGTKRCGLRSSLIDVPSTRSVVGSGRCSASTPSSEKPLALRNSVEPEICGSPGGDHSDRSPCRDIVFWNHAMDLGGKTVEREGRRLGPTASELYGARPTRIDGPLHFADPNRAKEIENRKVPEQEEGEIVPVRLRWRSEITEDEAHKGASSSVPRTKAPVMVENTLITRSTHNDTEQQHQVVPFLGTEGAGRLATEHSTGGTVAISYPVESLCNPTMVGIFQPRKKVGPGPDGGGGCGYGGAPPLVLWGKHAQVYDADALQADQSVELVNRSRSQPLPRARVVKGATISLACDRSEGEEVHGESRIACFGAAKSAAEIARCGRPPEEQGERVERGGGLGRMTGANLRMTPAHLGKDCRRQWEPSGYGRAGIPPVICVRALGPIRATAAAGDPTTIAPGGSVAEGTSETSTVALVRSQAREPTQRENVREDGARREISDVPVRPRAEGPLSSRTTPALAQASEEVKDKNHHNPCEGHPADQSSSASHIPPQEHGHTLPPTAEKHGQFGKRSVCGSQQFERDLLPLADHGRNAMRGARLSGGQGVDSASPTETLRVSDSPLAFPAQLGAQSTTQSPTPSSYIDRTLSNHLSFSLRPPTPDRSSPLQVSAAHGSEVRDNERNISELAEEEQAAPVALVERIVRIDLTMTSPVTSPLARLSSSLLPSSPPALRSGQCPPFGAFPADKIDDAVLVLLSPSATLQTRAEQWRQGASDAGNDSQGRCTTSAPKLVTPPPPQKRSETKAASAEEMQGACDLGLNTNTAEKDSRGLAPKHWRSGLNNRPQRVESTTDLEGHEEPRARWSKRSDRGKRAGRESRQRHRQRYPPPPGPPPSPTPAAGRGKTCSKRTRSSLSSRTRCSVFMEEQEGRTRTDMVSEGTATVVRPTYGITVDGNHKLCHSSPRPFQAEGRSAPTDSEEDAALLDLAEVAVDWLPPPTPPPPEARRRRQRPRSPPASPTSPQPPRAIRVCVARTPSSPPRPSPRPSPPPHEQIHVTLGGEQNHSTREESLGDEGGHPSPNSRDFSPLIDHCCQSIEGEEEAPGEKFNGDNGATVPANTLRDAKCRGTDDTEGEDSSALQRGGRQRRETGRKMATAGAWAGSYEGSVAKRRADGILARVAALESYFDRVEEQAVVIPPTSLARGDVGTERQVCGTREDSACADHVRSRAAEGVTPADVAQPTLRAEQRAIARGSRDALFASDNARPPNLALCGRPGASASPVPQEAQSWSRRGKDSKEGACAGTTAIDCRKEPPRPMDHGTAIPATEDISGQVKVRRGGNLGESDSAGSDQSKETRSSFYFNLGRSMVLGDFEWDRATSGSALASWTGSAHGR